ncbi:helix-turn-helix domain-containing protein [Luteipulveratus mongoliensis]|uniref:HTH cro/C1-type domain-containing protein n=1 Tax=Luteipulveratus mongoliensis TaxID=571913 RepID=A0A0K1JDF3_9MICO|nr:transcriptional regulator [Luteipulveratus mongoliensis]AKU14638.1 hypothetical protein VV02_00090 [Luteipulveratus mongoliensis]
MSGQSVSVAGPDRAQDTEFADALRAAIEARGLGLERLREHLAHRGVSVSLATLSYWQSGRSRPERPSSLTAVGHLETILGVPPGELAMLLGPPRPRGRWSNQATDRPAIGAFWPSLYDVEDAVGQVNAFWDERLTRISQHDRVFVGPDRGEQSYVSRQVLRAERDGPDRWVVIMHLDEHDRALPQVQPLRHCHLGRTIAKPEVGLLVAELLFDRPLRRGETIITEHALINEAPCPLATNYERKFRLPVREFVLEIVFDPDVVPIHCEQYTRRENGEENVRVVQIDDTGSVHGIALDFEPGCYGFRWDWPSTAPDRAVASED